MNNKEERYTIDKVEEITTKINEYDDSISSTKSNIYIVTMNMAAMAINTATFLIKHGYTNYGRIIAGITGAITLLSAGYDIYLKKELENTKLERKNYLDELKQEVEDFKRGGK